MCYCVPSFVEPEPRIPINHSESFYVFYLNPTLNFTFSQKCQEMGNTSRVHEMTSSLVFKWWTFVEICEIILGSHVTFLFSNGLR